MHSFRRYICFLFDEPGTGSQNCEKSFNTCNLSMDFAAFVSQIKTRNKQQKLLDKTWETYISKTSNYETFKVTTFIFADKTSKFLHHSFELVFLDFCVLSHQEAKAARERHVESTRPKSRNKDATFHPTEVSHQTNDDINLNFEILMTPLPLSS